MKKIFLAVAAVLLLAAASVAILLTWPVPENSRRESSQAPSSSTSAPDPSGAPHLRTESTPAPIPQPTPVPLADWELQLDSILTGPGDTSTAALALLAAMPGLPAAAQEQYIAHALNLCEDGDFSRVNEIYLRSDTPPAVSESIFNDALNRPDEVKLPLMAKTMASPNHPMAAEAREILELYLDLEPGASPQGSWDAAVKDYLKNPQGR